MLIDQAEINERLSKIVSKLTTSVVLREDLMQEALTHLWQEESRLPGQTKSWYLQSCKFHLQHCLQAGRSIDSGKRRDGQVHIDHDEESGELFALGVTESVAFSHTSEREAVTWLSARLRPMEQTVLSQLTKGWGVREIARQLSVSHPTVTKSRRKIAGLLRRLGFVGICIGLTWLGGACDGDRNSCKKLSESRRRTLDEREPGGGLEKVSKSCRA
jgi:DNA-directed RNA polymerase specialized sigma24 family protein